MYINLHFLADLFFLLIKNLHYIWMETWPNNFLMKKKKNEQKLNSFIIVKVKTMYCVNAVWSCLGTIQLLGFSEAAQDHCTPNSSVILTGCCVIVQSKMCYMGMTHNIIQMSTVNKMMILALCKTHIILNQGHLIFFMKSASIRVHGSFVLYEMIKRSNWKLRRTRNMQKQVWSEIVWYFDFSTVKIKLKQCTEINGSVGPVFNGNSNMLFEMSAKGLCQRSSMCCRRMFI